MSSICKIKIGKTKIAQVYNMFRMNRFFVPYL